MSLEDLFQKKLCTCSHSIDEEHSEDGTCYALDFNGSIYSACRCKKIVPMKLSFKIERDEVSNPTTNKAATIKSIKPIKSAPTIIQWGRK